MGCGESKHAVATANTISQSKRSNSTKRKGPESAVDKATDDVKTDTNASVQSPENGISSGEMKKDSVVVKGNDNDANKAAPEVENAKESAKAKEDKEGNVPEGENVKESTNVRDNGDANGASEVEKVKEIEENVQAEILQAKDGESIESIISEGLSGKSEYQTPRAREGVSKGLTTENETTDAKGSPEETKIETKTEEEAANANDVKEAEAVSPAEGKDSAITKEEKASTAEEEILAEGSTKDSKTN